MPRMSSSVSVAANSASTNVLAGLLEEFLAADSAVRAMATTTATGVNCSFVMGRTAIVNDQLISFANRYPIIPDDTIAEHGGRRGTRLILTFRNTTAGALTVTWVVDITPLPRR
jgi:hypothetical protein